jgi:NAD+ synthase
VAGEQTHPHGLDLPRDDDGLATEPRATRRLRQVLSAVLEDIVVDADAEGVVLTLDGSVDTTVAATLAVEAVGVDCVTALVMPATMADEAGARDAEAVADLLGVEYRRLPLQPLVGAFQEVLGRSGQPGDDIVATENAIDRLRTACSYYVANTTDALVVGTTNRTRRLLGPLSKYGDTGVDCHLLGDCYRTEVDALAASLDVPESLRQRPVERLVGTDETVAERFGLAPRTLDRVLRLTVDEGDGPAAVADRVGVDPDTVARVGRWCTATRHKRRQPPKPSTYL